MTCEFQGLTALYHTLGCKLNFAETATVADIFAAHGIARAQEGDNPDYIVVNTCSVTEEADKKCRQAIRALHRRHPGAKIIVTGCYAQLRPGDLAGLPGVAVVAGNDRKQQLAQYLDGQHPVEVTPARDIRDFAPLCACGDRTRYFLKVQDGCDYWCTYCTIPAARGRSRSASVARTVDEARRAAGRGAKEIVITGVNIGDFGYGTDETFTDLCRALDRVDGVERYRISSIEPNLLTDELIDFTASSRRFMPHFHIPLQSGSDQVLRLMRRRYDTELFARKIERVRQAMPDAFIGVDLIAGARGETDALFDESKRFVEGLDISRLHVFTYSERPGTRALEMGEYVVPQAEKHRRTRLMMEVSERKLADFRGRFIGTERPVLVEHSLTHGFTDNYLRVNLPAGCGTALANTVARVRLVAPDADGAVKGEILE